LQRRKSVEPWQADLVEVAVAGVVACKDDVAADRAEPGVDVYLLDVQAAAVLAKDARAVERRPSPLP